MEIKQNILEQNGLKTVLKEKLANISNQNEKKITKYQTYEV